MAGKKVAPKLAEKKATPKEPKKEPKQHEGVCQFFTRDDLPKCKKGLKAWLDKCCFTHSCSSYRPTYFTGRPKKNGVQPDDYYGPLAERSDFSKDALRVLEFWNRCGIGRYKRAREELGMSDKRYRTAAKEVFDRMQLPNSRVLSRGNADRSVALAVVIGVIPTDTTPPESI